MRKPRPTPQLEPIALEGTAILVLHRQAMARVLHELESVGPKFREFSDLLKGVALTASEVPRVEVAKTNLDTLSAQLSRLLRENQDATDTEMAISAHGCAEGINTVASSSTTASATLIPPSTPPESHPCRYRKRRASSDLVILPPSPEKAQKRQDSHSIH